MSRHFESARPEQPFEETLRRMDSLNLATLLVCENGRLVGVLSNPDSLRRPRPKIAPGLTVRDVMSTEILTGAEDDDVRDAIHAMRLNGIDLIPVLDSQKGLAGTFSLGGPWKRHRRARRRSRVSAETPGR